MRDISLSKFPERLRYLRKLKGITQKELGKHLGYGYTAVSNYENAEHQPDYDTLMRIAEYTKIRQQKAAKQPPFSMKRKRTPKGVLKFYLFAITWRSQS